VALTFLVMVQFAAFRWGLVYSVCLSIGCTLLYNYFFLPPIGSFTISDPQNWIALLSFLRPRFSSAGSRKANGGRPR
jgi:two-component system sensor histidine kinase KdpD